MKSLPIGIQTLSQIRVRNAIYVDKTQLICQLTKQGAYYFFSRPRRFGKSLLISTLKELHKGNKSLFEGLWIYDNWDWSNTNPVIHISFDDMSYRTQSLEDALFQEMQLVANQYKIRLTTVNYKTRFKELIQKLAKKYGRVVILIDEYDKPIIDFLESHTIEKAKENRLILRDFYSILKNADEFIKFVFITGISKFAQMSIFSHLNNLKDITMDRKYATLTGYTQTELEHYFKDYLEDIQHELNISREALLAHMAIWYNGYSWDGVHKVYNPFGTLCFLSDQQFKNYWFGTGSPNFLIEQMKKQVYFDVENTIVNNAILNKYDIENIELIPLLFQTGYLTVKAIDAMTGDIVLDYPNKEVRESMYMFLIDDLAKNVHRVHTGRTIKDLNQAFLTKDLLKVRKILHSLLADLPYEVYQNQSEGLFHGLIHLIFSYLGMFVSSEVHSSQGRADAVVETLTDVYIFEFKFNKTAQEALTQIADNKYADKYLASDKIITGIGVNFNSTKRGIDEWLEGNFNT
jgi:Predicted AAA-ATPase/PD-(D/E)XK nuclease superfamily